MQYQCNFLDRLWSAVVGCDRLISCSVAVLYTVVGNKNMYDIKMVKTPKICKIIEKLKKTEQIVDEGG